VVKTVIGSYWVDGGSEESRAQLFKPEGGNSWEEWRERKGTDSNRTSGGDHFKCEGKSTPGFEEDKKKKGPRQTCVPGTKREGSKKGWGDKKGAGRVTMDRKEGAGETRG